MNKKSEQSNNDNKSINSNKKGNIDISCDDMLASSYVIHFLQLLSIISVAMEKRGCVKGGPGPGLDLEIHANLMRRVNT